MHSLGISIHAPRVGSDLPANRVYHLKLNFYPRSPRGERRPAPTWNNGRCRYFYPRSPRGERPSAGSGDLARAIGFLSTLPAWGATGTEWGAKLEVCISIHAPRVGSDPVFSLDAQKPLKISIHAPRVGSDNK